VKPVGHVAAPPIVAGGSQRPAVVVLLPCVLKQTLVVSTVPLNVELQLDASIVIIEMPEPIVSPIAPHTSIALSRSTATYSQPT
jgi:hypothetical protein